MPQVWDNQEASLEYLCKLSHWILYLLLIGQWTDMTSVLHSRQDKDFYTFMYYKQADTNASGTILNPTKLCQEEPGILLYQYFPNYPCTPVML